jgi:CYTH domain-containing protein
MQVNMKYAHIEQERRYLVIGNGTYPDPIRELYIRDLYFVGTNLRLRQVDEKAKPTVYKLGQKIRVGNDFQFQIAHTTMYISSEEFELVASLPAKKLEKKRFIFPLEDLHFALDEFEGALAGLSLIEVDLGHRDVTHAPLPIDGLIEVTSDERFTGGQLVKMNREDLGALLLEHGAK